MPKEKHKIIQHSKENDLTVAYEGPQRETSEIEIERMTRAIVTILQKHSNANE